MPDIDSLKESKNYHLDIPACNQPFFLKGSGALDWGMQNRLSRIFRPESGRTVMLAVDHGYFQGPTSGLERVDVNIVPLAPYADALMLTRGMLRSTIPSDVRARASSCGRAAAPASSRSCPTSSWPWTWRTRIRMNVAAMAVQVFIGGEYETQSIHNMTRLVDVGYRYGIPVLGVTAVGKNMTRDARYFRLACRMIAELGANFVKTYYVEEDFETITASCPVPIVMAGGKKLPELDALTMAYKAVERRRRRASTWAATSSSPTRRWP